MLINIWRFYGIFLTFYSKSSHNRTDSSHCPKSLFS